MANTDMMYISMLSVLIPTVLGLAVFKRLLKPLRILTIFIVSVIVMQVIVYVFYVNSINNLAVFHVYTYIEFASISLIYFYIFKSQRYLKIMVGAFFVAFIMFSVANSIFYEPLSSFNSNQRVVEFCLVLVYLLLLFSTVLKKERSAVLELQPYFILSFGHVVYFSGTLFLFLNAHHYMDLGIPNQWILHSLLNIFINIIYFIVLWKGSKRITH